MAGNNAYVVDGVVSEIIVPLAGFMIADRYSPDFVKKCFPCGDDVQPGWIHDGKKFAAPEPVEVTKDDLTAYAANKRWQVETGGVAINGMQIATDRESQAMISSAFQVASVTGQTIKFKTAGGFVELSPEQMQGIALAVAAHVQASFAAEAAVIDAIQAGEISSAEQIESSAWPGAAQ